jgi:hypothetical protein
VLTEYHARATTDFDTHSTGPRDYS